MAETDGTPSAPKPVDGETPSESATASSVPVSPVVTVVRPSDSSSSEEATRAALRKTLQAGVGAAAAQAAANPSSQDRAAGELFEQARRAAALADTQQDLPRTPGVTGTPRPARNPKLARTLRMDLKLPPSSEEAIGGEPAPSSSAPPGRTLSPRPHVPTQHGMPLPHVQQPQAQPGENTGSRPAYGAPPVQAQAYVQPPGMDPHGSTRVGYDDSPHGSRGPANVHGAAPSMRRSMPPTPRKRPLRPGERTMILSKRGTGKKDWLFVVLVVGALGVTASMLLAYHNQSSDGSEGAETVAEEEPAEQEPEAQPEDTTQQAASAEPAQPANSGVRATELRSDPVGAEVVVNGAVVGNTPVRVARADTDVDYTLRLPGYEPKIVRVGAQSPATISVTLRPNTP